MRRWFFKGWKHEDYVAVRFMAALSWAFFLGFVLGRVL